MLLIIWGTLATGNQHPCSWSSHCTYKQCSIDKKRCSPKIYKIILAASDHPSLPSPSQLLSLFWRPGCSPCWIREPDAHPSHASRMLACFLSHLQRDWWWVESRLYTWRYRPSVFASGEELSQPSSASGEELPQPLAGIMATLTTLEPTPYRIPFWGLYSTCSRHKKQQQPNLHSHSFPLELQVFLVQSCSNFLGHITIQCANHGLPNHNSFISRPFRTFNPIWYPESEFQHVLQICSQQSSAGFSTKMCPTKTQRVQSLAPPTLDSASVWALSPGSIGLWLFSRYKHMGGVFFFFFVWHCASEVCR